MLLPAARHEVSFWHGQDRLCGDLRVPVTSGRHPVVLLVRDPDEAQRDYSPWLDDLAVAGIASFTWDRPSFLPEASRGARSVGRHAREVLSAVDRLRFVPDLDPAAVALLGWGRGGWAAAQATTYSNDVRALVLASPLVARPGPDGVEHDLRPTLSAVTVPVLALFGERDPLLEPRESVRTVRATLRDAGHVDHEVAVVRGADHGLRVRAPHGLGAMVGGFHRFGDWPAALTDLLVRWLDRRLRPQEIPTYAPPLRAPQVRFPARTRIPLPAPVPVRQVRRRVPL
ncbi:MAG TPA: dienelactone hydrolase family protein [Kineosporiaceae bacterium]